MKPVIADKDDIEIRDKSKVKAILEFLEFDEPDARKMSMICQSHFLHKFEAVNSEQDESYQDGLYGN